MDDLGEAVRTISERTCRGVSLLLFGELVRGSVEVGVRHLMEIWTDMRDTDSEDRHATFQEYSAAVGVDLARLMGSTRAPEDELVLALSDAIEDWWVEVCAESGRV